jgi:SAM-dependent methyltransferase
VAVPTEASNDMTIKSWVYDLMYRFWAPWDAVGVRKDLIDLIEQGDTSPERFPRSIDLGCGTGANVVYLADQGFDSWGVDFSEVAIRKAKTRAANAGVSPHLVVGDLTAPDIDGVQEPFDLLIDFGTLDDLRGAGRTHMAENINRFSRPGSRFLEYCFFGEREELPWVSMNASKMSHIAPGELESLFGDLWDIEPFADYPEWRTAVFLLTRR